MKKLKSTENVIDILLTLENSDSDGLGLNELGRKTGINKSTVFNILKTLEIENFVVQDKNTKKYKLGFGLIKLGNKVLKDIDLRDVAEQSMKELANLTSSTVTLGIRYENKFIFIERIDGVENVRFYCDVGKVTPFFKGAASKAYFANLSDEEIKKFIKCMENEDYDKVKQEINEILEKGYSISDEEVDKGVIAFGCPIFDYKHEVVAGMAIANIKSNINEEKKKENIELLKYYSNEISKKLGC